MNSSSGNIPIEIIDTRQKLTAVVEQLNQCTEIFVDTEFDDFNTQYGLHLQLIQVFDKTACYLIDPIRIKNLDTLWQVFENENICKVLYSGANDVAVLKKYECYTKNIFDIQVAAVLCNRTANSYSDLLQAELGVAIDKSQQRSRWDNRPLTADQLLYASNDVVFLPRLKEIFLLEIAETNMLHVMQEENILVEAATKKDYAPKLKPAQKRIFNFYARTKLMEFKLMVNDYAKLLNVPPNYIVQDSLLEEIIKDKTGFLSNPFQKGFHKDVLNNDQFKKQFLEMAASVNMAKGWENSGSIKFSKEHISTSEDEGKLINENFLSFKQYVLSRFGEVAGSSILRGLSKRFLDDVVEWEGTRQYQRDLYKEFLAGS